MLSDTMHAISLKADRVLSFRKKLDDIMKRNDTFTLGFFSWGKNKYNKELVAFSRLKILQHSLNKEWIRLRKDEYK